MGQSHRDFNRRGFLQAAAGATVAVGAVSLAGAMPAAAAGPATEGERGGRSRLTIPKDAIGIQLYSVRDKVAHLGFRLVFEELSRMGYQEVEFAGYTQDTSILGRQITIPEIRQLLNDNGLRAIGSHVGIGNLRNGLQQELDNAQILGMPHIGTPNAPSDTGTVAAYRAAAQEFNAWGEAAAARGLKLYQHNHFSEFAFASDQPEVRLYDVFLNGTDPRYVFLEMDVYWAYVGQYRWPGFDPAAYVRRNPYRYPLFHMKDGETDPANANGYDIVEFGAGDLPYHRFVHAIGSRGSHRGIWEQDTAPGTQPDPPGSLGAAERSYSALADLLS
ncbi:sugar phosphate isomerase/epimerase family protein [Actinacidiphila soli]|jgi:sugar phosphate isomerase/epimerase|uniref:sugar phosphate isomerase/epimerase family protein n=1 Tax=Actinacidiphila soli TaxID=2487275 RepID=UPI000FCACD32|nr:sugar phosphate isomerase/epimerase [Actinacidiphila soli]